MSRIAGHLLTYNAAGTRSKSVFCNLETLLSRFQDILINMDVSGGREVSIKKGRFANAWISAE